MIFNYQKVCSEFLEGLSQRTRDVLERRFGLKTGKRETLEAIGQGYGVTRERIRQIEANGLSGLKPKLKKGQKIYQHFNNTLLNYGKLKKEDILLSTLGGQKFNPHVFFLLNLDEEFKRFSENEDLFSLWTIDPNSLNVAKGIIADFYQKLQDCHEPLDLADYSPPTFVKPKALASYLEVSKLIGQGPEGEFGLKDWPEINPRGVKDRAYLVFKKEKKPLHFAKVAELIGEDALVQTVHNELIRDPRFVLIGRGIYALSEWGYKSGTVQDIIIETLKEAKKPLSREEVLEGVLKQRLVKENTVLLNLSNKKYFLRDSKENYFLKNA